MNKDHMTRNAKAEMKSDWDRLRSMDSAETEAAARGDADNPMLGEEQLNTLGRVARVKIIRRALHLTQEEFASRYLIPLGTLRDWEQGRTEPDQAARAYLRVIAKEPETVSRALGTRDAA